MAARSPRLNRSKALLSLCVVTMTAAPAHARITRVELDPAKRTIIEQPSSAVGSYERLVGVAYGELDPKDKHNSLIQDIQLAPRNSRGMVEYATVFTLTKPVDLSKADGTLLYEVVNRSNESVGRTFSNAADNGDQFMMRRGVIILRSGWQGDIPWSEKGVAGGQAYALKVPIAKNSDGSQITGPVLARIFNENGSTAPLRVFSRPLPYPPVRLEGAKGVLTLRSRETFSSSDVVTEVPAADWAWADCTQTKFPGAPDPNKICLKNGFDPQLLYEVVYEAKDPLVLGIGFAATRDIVSHFRHATDTSAVAHPIAKTVRRVIGYGLSQTGQFVRSYINLGFNEDERGRIVWDGAMAHIAGRQLGLNFRFALPDGTATPNVPDGQGVMWWGTWKDEPRGHESASLLSRCTATKTCPKIFETMGAAEFWNIRMSPGLIGTDAKQDIGLPDNVRRYYFPGISHGGGGGGFSTQTTKSDSALYKTACTLPGNPNASGPSMRALFVALDAWIGKGTEPPQSLYPKLADGTLVPDTKEAVGFPDIPGVALKDHLGIPQFDYDFGPRLLHDDVSGVLTKLPPDIKGVIPAYVVRVNRDGNEISGVASVLHQAPLGTYTGWNISSSGFYKDALCPFGGSFIPFPATKAAAKAAGDPRQSLESRYGDHEGYVKAVVAAATNDVKRRHLLQEDADRLIAEVQASSVLKER
jgi:hypothetical protein